MRPYPSKFFKDSELACPCCNWDIATYQLVLELDKIRDVLGRPVFLSSVVRCEAHNRDVGGTENSSHLKGVAADIKIKNDVERSNVINAIILSTNIRRFGVYSHSIHVDIDQAKNQNRVWYGNY